LRIDPAYTDRFSLGLLLLLGLTLLAGVTIDFSFDLIWNDQQRIEQIFLLGVTAIAAATIWRNTLSMTLISLSLLNRWMLGFGFTLGGISVALSTYPHFASLEWASMMLLLILALLLGGQARLENVRFDRWAIRLVMALGVVIALKIMAGYVAAVAEHLQIDSATMFAGTFSNQRVFGQIASMVIPVLSFSLLSRKLPQIQRWGLLTLIALWWMLVILSGTRGTFLALFTSAGVLALAVGPPSYYLLKIQTLTLSIGIILFGILFWYIPHLLGLGTVLQNRLHDLTSLSGRQVLWSMAWHQIQSHPWLGIGPMHFATLRNVYGAHPHNAILQLAVEWGIPATLAFVIAATTGFLSLLSELRHPKIKSDPSLLCLAASLLATSTQAMVDGIIVIPYTQTWLVFIAGWTLGVYYRNAHDHIPSEPQTMRVFVPVLTLFALFFLLHGVFPEILNRAEVNQAFIQKGGILIPRYWSLGWIPQP